MTGPDPMEYGWWLASRAAGVVALLCIAVSVGVGLAMASRLAPRSARGLLSIHQQTALAGLVAIAVHGITLLGDRFLSPSLGDIAIPFTSEHEPLWTGLGVTGGWLAAVLGLSYWIRTRIGPGLWRRLHKATILVYVLSVAHTLGAGTDASEPWMLSLLAATAAPIVFLFLLRVLTPAPPPAFRRFRVADIRPESSSVLSFELVPADGRPAPPHEPGQFVPVRVGDEVRSYSLSSASRRRISVKREGRVSTHLHTAVEVGDVLDVGAPSGTFVVGPPSDVPLVLISAGIGVTPLLAMLESQAGSERAIWWVHSARDAAEHAFRGEAKAHLARIAHGHSHVRYTREEGRLTGAQILALGVPVDAEFRLCGPTRFVADMTADLAAAGAERIESESFGGAPAPGPVVKFSRSGVTATYDARHTSLLEVAEANAVPVASGCRIGACHGCRAGVVTGTVRHQPEPLQPPPPGSALLCCAVPEGDVVLDA